MNLVDYGILRIAAVTPRLHLADPHQNAREISELYQRCAERECAVIVTPELSLTGYSCEDLFNTRDLQRHSDAALVELARATDHALLIVGAPCMLPDQRRLNCAFACADGQILGAVPKISIPNHEEFYESRWFSTGWGVHEKLVIEGMGFHVCSHQLFQVADSFLGLEICEDLWAPEPVSSRHALAGATIIANPSASPEVVSKADYRRDLVRMQSARCLAAYIYSGSGVLESSKDIVYGGHKLLAENGEVIAESARFALEASDCIGDIDTRKLEHQRMRSTTFSHAHRSTEYRFVRRKSSLQLKSTTRRYLQQPFVPLDERELDARAAEILSIQAAGLARRVASAGTESLVIGVSGGIDSTLALLVCCDAVETLGQSRDVIHSITMPGAGTTSHTRASVDMLTDALDLTLTEIPIHSAVESHLDDLAHAGASDIVFENSQARERTQILFDLANKLNGIVVGTGDLSEIALGWCTFNADHMAGYNVNAGVPKTLVTYIVRWFAMHRAGPSLRSALERVVNTEITPELLPTEGDEIVQPTRDIIGPYDLHDFFLYHMMRTGASVRKILVLARLAFSELYPDETIHQTLEVFIERFHAQQFKRSTQPPGPKVGTVCLSPRGDWRMPDEASPSMWLRDLDEFVQNEG